MSRRASATIRTTHGDADRIARALAPDNTDEMETLVDGQTVVTRIDRETTSGLQSTVDDYVVNIDVAMTVAQHAKPTDTGPVSDTNPETDTTNE